MFVRNMKEPGRYADGHGLYLFVDRSGAKRWVQRLVIQGKRTDLGLGPVSLVSLAEARSLAEANRRLARSGGDPLHEKREAREVLTFAQAVERYLEKKRAEFRNDKHRKQWRATLDTYAGPVIGPKRVADITRLDVLRVLEPIWETKTETASRLRGRIEAVLSWATVAGHRMGDNPARWAGNLSELLPKPGKVAAKGNHPALALADLPRWWADLRTREGMAARALQFLTLTAARSGEVRGMTWDEVELEAKLWTVPAARMKMSREHRVPLTDEAVAVLRALPRLDGSPYVFFAPRGGMMSDMTISAVMRRMQEAEERRLTEVDRKAGRKPSTASRGYLDPRSKRPAVPHGLRSSFRDWVSEHTSYPGDMAEVALAHKISNAVEAAYRRGDQLEKRRQMMEDWGQMLQGTRSATAATPYGDN
ncbi:tyrosine-type recombinase/integrase [Rubellimicrobium roseum]